jgi:hypothetical protein
MRVVLRRDKVSNLWKLEVPHAAHNHSSSTAIAAHPAHRLAALSKDTRALISNLSSLGLSPAKILTILRKADPDIALTPKDIANLTYQERLEELNGKTPIQWLLEELKNNGFRPQYYLESGHLERLAYIHPKSLVLWKQNPDILLLDCTYKTNRFNMPLLNIYAITGNNMVIQVRLVFLSSEKEADYT